MYEYVVIVAFSLQGEKLRMEQERDSYKMEVEHLRGDLEVTENEIAKEEKKQKVCCGMKCMVTSYELMA